MTVGSFLDRPFSRTEFERRQRRQLLGLELAVCSPEDSVLSKLEWAARSGGSERQIRDVVGVVVEHRGEHLDGGGDLGREDLVSAGLAREWDV